MGDRSRDPLARGDETATVSDRAGRAVAPIGDERPEPAEPAEPAFGSPDPARFEPRGELGRGGMGRVIEAFDRELDRDVAIKQMLSDVEVDVARFEREIRITAKLEHPAIVPIYEAGASADGRPYYVMRKIDGRALDHLVTEARELGDRLALVPNILAACDAAAFAHARRIIHRDIKPANILVGPFGETLLIDWGLARELDLAAGDHGARADADPQLTRAGTVAGTPGFMSPEQARGQGTDARADVFALGSTLFYVIAGEPPYAGTSATEMIESVAIDRAPNWSQLPGDVPADLRAIVVKAMAPEPGARYPDAGGLAADLRRFLTGNLVAAHRYTRRDQVRRFVRRHRAAVAVAAISLAILIAGSVVMIGRIVSERDEATAARALAEARQRESASTTDRVLVQRAIELADTDPIASIAVLRRLPPESEHWREAAVAAAAAHARGIPFGFTGSERDRAVPVMSPDSERMITVGQRDGRVLLYDLVARTRRELSVPGAGKVRWSSAAWLDVRHVVLASFVDLTIVDTETIARTVIPVPQQVAWIGPGGGGCWMISDDREAFEITATTTALAPPIARDVLSILQAGDRQVIVHPRSAEIRSPTETWELELPETQGGVQGAIAGGELLVIANRAGIRAYDLDGRRGPLWNAEQVAGVPVAIIEGKVYVQTLSGQVVIRRDGRPHQLQHEPVRMFPTSRGFATAFADGSIDVTDAVGWFSIGKRPVQYTRVNATPDGRFVVAITNLGTVLVWDLVGYRPASYLLPENMRPVRLTTRSIWALDAVQSLARVDRATGDREIVAARMMTGAYVDPDERWAVGWNAIAGGLFVIDLATRRTVAERANAMFDLDDRGVTLGSSDGRVERWEPGAPPEPIAELGRPLAAIASRTPYVAVALPGEVVRIHLPSRRIDRVTLAGDVDSLAVTADGRVWAALDGGLWQWDRDRPPIRIPFEERAAALGWTGRGLAARSPSWIALLETTPIRVFQIASTIWGPAGSRDQVPVLTAQHEVAIVDLASGLPFMLSYKMAFAPDVLLTAGSSFASAHVAAHTGIEVLIWDLSAVPTERVALQRWLGEVTNARSFKDSEAIAWP